ncbi:MAG: hypothetical protein RIS70_2394 [Planctomycetota bacterium]
MGAIEGAMGCANGLGRHVLLRRLPRCQVCRIECHLEPGEPFTGRAGVISGRTISKLQRTDLSGLRLRIAGLQCGQLRMACVLLMAAGRVLVVPVLNMPLFSMLMLSMPVLMSVRRMPVLASSTMANRYEHRLGHQNCGNDPSEKRATGEHQLLR